MRADIQRGALEIRCGHLRDVFGDAVESRVILAQQRSAGVVDKAAKAQRADVVDPLHRRLGVGDHVFAGGIIKIAVLHRGGDPFWGGEGTRDSSIRNSVIRKGNQALGRFGEEADDLSLSQ